MTERPESYRVVLHASRVPATDYELEEARRHLVAWIQWFMKNPKNDCGTQTKLGEKLGVDQSTVSLWFKTGSKRLPDFGPLMSIKKLLKVPLDVLLGTDPP